MGNWQIFFDVGMVTFIISLIITNTPNIINNATKDYVKKQIPKLYSGYTNIILENDDNKLLKLKQKIIHDVDKNAPSFNKYTNIIVNDDMTAEEKYLV